MRIGKYHAQMRADTYLINTSTIRQLIVRSLARCKARARLETLLIDFFDRARDYATSKPKVDSN